MRILFVTYRSPWPPVTGDRVRALQHLRLLSQRHRISLVTLATRRGETAPPELRELCEAVHVVPFSRFAARLRTVRALAGNNPLQVAYYGSPELGRTVAKLHASNPFDAVYLSLVRTAGNGAALPKVPRVLDFCDACSMHLQRRAEQSSGWRRWLLHVESRRLARMERELADQVEQALITSPLDAAQIPGSRPPRVIPNAIDLEPDVPVLSSQRLPVGRWNIGFLGDMSTAYSATAVEYFMGRVWPQVRQACPQAHFWIIGRDPCRAIQRFASADVLVTGAVSSFKLYLQRLQVVVAPMQFGSGIKNRVLQAMAQGVPVVGSSIANEGLDATPGSDLFIEDDPQAFARRIIELLDDPMCQQRVGLAGRAFVHRYLHPDLIAELLEQALADACSAFEQASPRLTGARAAA
jgi:sugar transferase (PEP-CTERM/EpsH1 system associated)